MKDFFETFVPTHLNYLFDLPLKTLSFLSQSNLKDFLRLALLNILNNFHYKAILGFSLWKHNF